MTTDAERLEALKLKIVSKIGLWNWNDISYVICGDMSSSSIEIARLTEENNYFKTEYQDEAGIIQLQENIGFLRADIAKARSWLLSPEARTIAEQHMRHIPGQADSVTFETMILPVLRALVEGK